MRLKKSNFLIVLLSIIAITNISIIISANDAWSLMASDRDHDGILDDLDECPLVSENYNRFEDTDGCPDSVIEEKTKFEFPDTDGDGFEDRVDNCVNLPETFNGYLDNDGCPERLPNDLKPESDSDFDSIPDSIDACPMEKETINGFKDADGCPDSLDSSTSKPSGDSLTDDQCRDAKVAVKRINTKSVVCVSLDTAKKWEEYGIATIVSQPSEVEEITEVPKIIGVKTYDEVLNPRQIEYPNHQGFNDLHIEAINHLIPDGDDSVLDMIVHHHCKMYNDMTAACLLFPTGMGDQDKPYGIEYVIGADSYAELSDEEKTFWHYHKTELPNVNAKLPDLTLDETKPLMPILNETYGKVVYFWKLGDKYPIGEPFVVVIEELYKDKKHDSE